MIYKSIIKYEILMDKSDKICATYDTEIYKTLLREIKET